MLEHLVRHERIVGARGRLRLLPLKGSLIDCVRDLGHEHVRRQERTLTVHVVQIVGLLGMLLNQFVHG